MDNPEVPQTYTIAIRLDPRELTNPDTDLRYVLPDLIIERSAGALADDGWGYEGEPNFMVMFLSTSDRETGLEVVLDVIRNETVMGNQFTSGCLVGVRNRERSGEDALHEDFTGYEVVYPEEFAGVFDPSG